MTDTAADVLELATELPLFTGYPDFSPDAAASISDKDASDHHAIIPAVEVGEANLTALSIEERSLLFSIRCRLLYGTASPYVHEMVTTVFECGRCCFTTNGERVLMEGWKTFERLFRTSLREKPEDDVGNESDLPELTQGRIFEHAVVFIAERYITPPKSYTEDMLLPATEYADKDGMPEDTEWEGLGTPATGIAITEELVPSGFVERRGKSLIPTKDGINLITALPEVLASSPLATGWEKGLSEIARNAINQRTSMEGIQKVVAELVSSYSHISEDGQELPAPQKEPIDPCPCCGERVYEGKRNFCYGNRDHGFVLWKNGRFWLLREKELIKKMAADLLKKGRVEVKGTHSEKEGTTYGVAVILNDTGGKCIDFKLGFEEGREYANER